RGLEPTRLPLAASVLCRAWRRHRAGTIRGIAGLGTGETGRDRAARVNCDRRCRRDRLAPRPVSNPRRVVIGNVYLAEPRFDRLDRGVRNRAAISILV